jgi:transcriptional regulator with XRE-family HTH domain
MRYNAPEVEGKKMNKATGNKRGSATAAGQEGIAQRLVRLRKERGWTQVEMAQRLGVSQSVVSDYERGALRLHGELIAQVAELLAVSADELLGRATEQERRGPAGKMQRLFEQASELPRRQQEKVVAVLEAFVAQHANNQSATAE